MGFIRGYMVVLLFIFLTRTSIDGAKTRKLKMKLFSCPAEHVSQNYSIIHVEANAPDNSSTIHYLWTTYPIPTIIVAYTTLDNVKLNVNCKSLISNHTGGISFSPGINYTVGFAIPRIYEYDDEDDKVDLTDNSKMVVHKLASDIVWKTDIKPPGQVTFTGNEKLIFNCIASDSEGRESSLPHMKHTVDSTRFFLTLNNMTVSTNKTRFAAELNYIVHKDSKPNVNMEKSIDDEYSPAVFETVYGKMMEKTGKAYSQWKPVAYTKPELGRKSQTRASAGDIQTVTNRSHSISEIVMDEINVYGLNISFGLTKDGFYQKNKYLIWAGIVGYGDPPDTSLSFLIILIISIGLGLPLAIIIFGGAYVQIRKRCVKSNVSTSYARIN